jgi:hypothetical protein
MEKKSEPRGPEAAKEFVAIDAQQPADQPEKKGNAAPPRKIRYTSDQRLVVEAFDKAVDDLDGAIMASQGALATSELNTSPGSPRSGIWRVRVPVDEFNKFRAAVAKIGELERNTVDSEDLTERYYDLEAHIKNRLAEREALRELLKEVGKKEIKHFLEVKRELDAISDDINRKEGQLRLWANLTDLTTCTVHLREKQPFVQTKIEDKEIPTFGKRASTAWTDSLETLVHFGQWVAIAAVVATPWLPIVLVIGIGVWLAVRVSRRTKPEQVVLLVEAAESKKA